MRIIEESLTFDIISTITDMPCYYDRFEYCDLLRKHKLYKEAEELENKLTEEDFNYLWGLYKRTHSPTVQ